MRKIFNRDHILIQGIYYLMACMIFVYETYSLLQRGLSSSLIGIIFSIGQLLNIIIQFLVSEYLDKHDNVSSFQASLYTVIALIVLFIVNVLLNTPTLLLVIVNIMILALNESMTPLTNSFSNAYKKAGYLVHYGVARAIGSLSFAITSVIYGFLTEKFDYHIITYSMLGFSLMLFIVLFFSNKHYQSVEIEKEKVTYENIKTIDFIKEHYMFIVLCFGFGLIMATSNSTENFTLQIIGRVGGTSLDNGLIQGLRAFCEVPVIFNFHKIEKKISIKTIYWIAAVSYVLKASALLSPSLVIMYLAQFLQLISFSFLLPATISYIGKIMKPKETSRGYAMQTSITSVVSICMNGIAGFIIDSFGVYVLCIVCLTTTTFGAFTLLYSIHNLEK